MARPACLSCSSSGGRLGFPGTCWRVCANRGVYGPVEVSVFAFVRVSRVSLLATLFMLVSVAVGVPAVAAVGSESHCVVRVVGERPDGEFVVSPQVCFGTLAEALSYASGGTASFDAGLTGEVLLADEGGVASIVSSFTLGVHFDGFNGTGSSISVVGSSCSGGYWNTGAAWANVGSIGLAWVLSGRSNRVDDISVSRANVAIRISLQPYGRSVDGNLRR